MVGRETTVGGRDGSRDRRRHLVVESGHTLMGIQTAAFAKGRWWFGCYGNARTMLKTDESWRRVDGFCVIWR